MTLGFSTHWPKDMPDHMAGKPTYFVEKIWQSFPDEIATEAFTEYLIGLDDVNYEFDIDANLMIPKPHSLREDSKNKWKVGMMIHPVINNRSKNRFQFAPVVQCVSIQKIEIKHFASHIDVEIDGIPYLVEKNSKGRIYIYTGTIEVLAKNDGFDSIHDFFSWFKEDFTGKIIHWTDLKY